MKRKSSLTKNQTRHFDEHISSPPALGEEKKNMIWKITFTRLLFRGLDNPSTSVFEGGGLGRVVTKKPGFSISIIGELGLWRPTCMDTREGLVLRDGGRGLES